MTPIAAPVSTMRPNGIVPPPWHRAGAPQEPYEDAELASLRSRALAYLAAGVPIHFRGPAGTGKTTMALRVAGERSRPITFLTGDRWMTRADLVGRQVGHSARHVRDSYIASVRRTESHSRAEWRDAALSQAMAEGHTLVYDEFTRASAEANATLLSVLEEGIIVFTDPAAGRQYQTAHPDFAVILTSNPSDYVGVDLAPDALIDRMVTFDLACVSAETECGIVATRTGLARHDAARLVRLVRDLRAAAPETFPVSMRTAILIGRLVAAQDVPVDAKDPRFLQICADVLQSRTGNATQETLIRQILRDHLPRSDDVERPAR